MERNHKSILSITTTKKYGYLIYTLSDNAINPIKAGGAFGDPPPRKGLRE